MHCQLSLRTGDASVQEVSKLASILVPSTPHAAPPSPPHLPLTQTLHCVVRFIVFVLLLLLGAFWKLHAILLDLKRPIFVTFTV